MGNQSIQLLLFALHSQDNFLVLFALWQLAVQSIHVLCQFLCRIYCQFRFSGLENAFQLKQDGIGCEANADMTFNSVFQAVVDWTDGQVRLVEAEGPLDVPEILVLLNDFRCWQCGVCHVSLYAIPRGVPVEFVHVY